MKYTGTEPLSGDGDVVTKNTTHGDEKAASPAESNNTPQKVSFLKLFSFADFYDCVLMGLGSVGACIHGVSVPVFFIFFGKLINVIGLAYFFPKEAAPKVAKVRTFRTFSRLRERPQRRATS